MRYLTWCDVIDYGLLRIAIYLNEGRAARARELPLARHRYERWELMAESRVRPLRARQRDAEEYAHADYMARAPPECRWRVLVPMKKHDAMMIYDGCAHIEDRRDETHLLSEYWIYSSWLPRQVEAQAGAANILSLRRSWRRAAGCLADARLGATLIIDAGCTQQPKIASRKPRVYADYICWRYVIYIEHRRGIAAYDILVYRSSITLGNSRRHYILIEDFSLWMIDDMPGY